MVLAQVVKMSDEVTVSSLPHPISMFMLGIFAITIVFLLVEMSRHRKTVNDLSNKFHESDKFQNSFKKEIENKFSDLSKKIDSRVDKAISSLKKEKNVL
jgi:hypothetical protein